MKKLFLALAFGSVASVASAEVLTFEGVQFTQFQANVISGYSLSNTNFNFGPAGFNYPGYGNLKWSNNSGNNDFRIVEAAHFLNRNPDTPANNGITNGLVSGSWVAVNGGSADVWFEKLGTSAQNFNFTSAYMGAAWYDGLKVDIMGYRNGAEVYSTTVTLAYNTALQTFNWSNLDKVVFHSRQDSGTVIDNQSTYNHAFVMDNLNVAAVPEPEQYAMLLAGLGLIGSIARRKQKQA